MYIRRAYSQCMLMALSNLNRYRLYVQRMTTRGVYFRLHMFLVLFLFSKYMFSEVRYSQFCPAKILSISKLTSKRLRVLCALTARKIYNVVFFCNYRFFNIKNLNSIILNFSGLSRPNFQTLDQLLLSSTQRTDQFLLSSTVCNRLI